MTYTVTWYRYPNGNEEEAMDSKCRDFDNIEKAVAFARHRAEIIRGIYWAGAFVEDEDGKEILNITDGYSEYWYGSHKPAKSSDYDESGMVKDPAEIITTDEEYIMSGADYCVPFPIPRTINSTKKPNKSQ